MNLFIKESCPLVLLAVLSLLPTAATAQAGDTAETSFIDEATILARYISIRPGLASFSWENKADSSPVADYHPFTGMFRISAGVLDLDSQLRSRDETPSGRRSDAAVNRMDRLSQRITASTRQPYVGFGWGASPSGDGAWTFNLDIGMMYQGTDCINAIDTARCLQLNNTPVNELSVSDGLEKYGWLPVLSGGITFKF